MTRQALLDLAARCEAATEPSRSIDLDIMRYVMNIGGDSKNALHYTASLDAAMTMVPEGAGLSLSRYWIASKDGPVWSAEIAQGGLPDDPRRVSDCYDAATPALALTAACLRALAQEMEL